jgi:hypothetical protein
MLNRVQSKPHKAFYAADVLLDDVLLKGIIAEFVETRSPHSKVTGPSVIESASPPVHAADLPEDQRVWYDPFDYIDADRKPSDLNPTFELVDLGDCPQASLGMRGKARQSSSADDDAHNRDQAPDMETTKFGHEETHVCYLGKGESENAVQLKRYEVRMAELLRELHSAQNGERTKVRLWASSGIGRANHFSSRRQRASTASAPYRRRWTCYGYPQMSCVKKGAMRILSSARSTSTAPG